MNKHVWWLWTLVFAIEVSAQNNLESEFLSIYGDEEIVSIANGYSKPISKAPAVASIITQQDIYESGSQNLDELLEMVPGLHVGRDVISYNPLYTFRGILADYNPQVLLLVDGVPFTSLFHGDRHLIWGGFPVNMISRVEIIRGPGSSLYGSDAFAGVINVITKKYSELSQPQTGGLYGSNGTGNLWGGYGREFSETRYWFSVEASQTEGNEEVISADAQSFLDSITGTNASLAPGSLNLGKKSLDLRFGFEHKKLEVVLWSQYRETENGTGVALALDSNNKYKSVRNNISVSYRDMSFFDHMRTELSMTVSDYSQEIVDNLILFPPGSTGPFLDEFNNGIFGIFEEGVIGNPEVFERHSRINVKNFIEGIDNNEITFGFGYYYGDLYKTIEEKNFGLDPATGEYILPGTGLVDVSDTPFVFLRENERENSYLYAQDVIRIANDWELTAGFRFDHYSDFGDTLNPRIALVWSARHDLTTKLLYGEAFRAPSFAQLGNINNPAAIGNPNLDPETMRSLELVFDYQYAHNIEVVFNTFYYQWEDIIQFFPDSVSGFRVAQNSGEQDGHGVELEANWQPNAGLTITGNYAWQDSRDKKSNQTAPNSPRHQLYVRTNWQLTDTFSFNLQSNWVLDRARAQGDLRNKIENYVLTNITLRYSNPLNKYVVSLLVKNIFDEDAREPSPNGVPVALIPDDLPLPGRTIFGEIRLSF